MIMKAIVKYNHIGENPTTITGYWLKLVTVTVTVTEVAGWPKSSTGSGNWIVN